MDFLADTSTLNLVIFFVVIPFLAGLTLVLRFMQAPRDGGPEPVRVQIPVPAPAAPVAAPPPSPAPPPSVAPGLELRIRQQEQELAQLRYAMHELRAELTEREQEVERLRLHERALDTLREEARRSELALESLRRAHEDHEPELLLAQIARRDNDLRLVREGLEQERARVKALSAELSDRGLAATFTADEQRRMQDQLDTLSGEYLELSQRWIEVSDENSRLHASLEKADDRAVEAERASRGAAEALEAFKREHRLTVEQLTERHREEQRALRAELDSVRPDRLEASTEALKRMEQTARAEAEERDALIAEVTRLLQGEEVLRSELESARIGAAASRRLAEDAVAGLKELRAQAERGRLAEAELARAQSVGPRTPAPAPAPAPAPTTAVPLAAPTQAEPAPSRARAPEPSAPPVRKLRGDGLFFDEPRLVKPRPPAASTLTEPEAESERRIDPDNRVDDLRGIFGAPAREIHRPAPARPAPKPSTEELEPSSGSQSHRVEDLRGVFGGRSLHAPMAVRPKLGNGDPIEPYDSSGGPLALAAEDTPRPAWLRTISPGADLEDEDDLSLETNDEDAMFAQAFVGDELPRGLLPPGAAVAVATVNTRANTVLDEDDEEEMLEMPATGIAEPSEWASEELPEPHSLPVHLAQAVLRRATGGLAPCEPAQLDRLAMHFDGTVARVVQEEAFEGLSGPGFTFEAWLRPRRAERKSTLMSYVARRRSCVAIYLEARGGPPAVSVVIDGEHTPLSAAVPLRLSAWQHVAVSWNAATGNIYVTVNGEERYSGALAGGARIPGAGRVVIGQDCHALWDDLNPGLSLQGEVAEVRVWRYSRTPEELAAAQFHRPPPSPHLVIWRTESPAD